MARREVQVSYDLGDVSLTATAVFNGWVAYSQSDMEYDLEEITIEDGAGTDVSKELKNIYVNRDMKSVYEIILQMLREEL